MARYTVREVIDKLESLIQQNVRIENAIFGICTINEDEDTYHSAYDIDIELENYYDANAKGSPQFTIDEHYEPDDCEYDDEYL